MRNKAATPLPQEWCHLIVIALVFCIPIMSAFSAAYLLIVRLMLIGWDVLIRPGAGMDFLLRPPPPTARQPRTTLVEIKTIVNGISSLGQGGRDARRHQRILLR